MIARIVGGGWHRSKESASQALIDFERPLLKPATFPNALPGCPNFPPAMSDLSYFMSVLTPYLCTDMSLDAISD